MRRKIKMAVKKFPGMMALLSAQIIIALIAFFISLSVLVIIIREIFYDKEYDMDERVFAYLKNFVTPVNNHIMEFFSLGGSHLFLVPAWILLIVFYYLKYKDRWMAIKMPVIALSNLLLMAGLKFFFNRPRPLIPLLKNVPGLSFPSGHAFMSFIFYGFVIYLVYHDVKNGRVKWSIISILVIIVLIIGLSRVYLRVHYASDVLAGYCFGMMSLLILLGLLKLIEKYNASRIPPPLNVTRPTGELPGG